MSLVARGHDNLAAFVLGVVVGAVVLFSGYRLGKEERSPTTICLLPAPPLPRAEGPPAPSPRPRPLTRAPRLGPAQAPERKAAHLPVAFGPVEVRRPALKRPAQPRLEEAEKYPRARRHRRLPRPQATPHPGQASGCDECPSGPAPQPATAAPGWHDGELPPEPWGPGPMADERNRRPPPGRPEFGPPPPCRHGPPPGY